MRGLCYFILSILSQVHSSTVRVASFVGHNATLPCSFDALAYGTLSFCWGKGMVPVFKCSNTILSWEDGTVQSWGGARYQLLGAVVDGDVSLTIIHARWSDAGVYGCRVEVPGLFNDQKINIQLFIEEEPEEEPVTQSYTQRGIKDVITTSSFKSTEEAYILSSVTQEVYDFFSFLGVENIVRLAAVSLVTVILILTFIFRKRLLPLNNSEEVDTSAADNIYESIPMH